jgi:hypothetical protein
MTDPAKGNSGSLFARPLQPLDSHAPARNDIFSGLRPAPGLALAGLMLATCTVLLLQSRPDGAQNLPSTRKKPAAAPAKRVQIALAERGNEAAKASDGSRPSLEFYTRGVRDSMFSAPQPPKPKDEPASKAARVIVPQIKPVPINPFADWSYAGTVTAGDKKMALLENRTSKEGVYVRDGQTFMGAQVKSVTDQMVTVVAVGKPYRLAKSDEIDITPLNASAGYLTAQPQQVANTDQAAASAQKLLLDMAAQAQAAGMVLPNGRVLSAGQAARFNNRMNGRFNGGPGGQGGQGGGGGGGRGRGGRGGGGPGGFGGQGG